MAETVSNPLIPLLTSLGSAIQNNGYCEPVIRPAFNAFKVAFDAAETRRQKAVEALRKLDTPEGESFQPRSVPIKGDTTAQLGSAGFNAGALAENGHMVGAYRDAIKPIIELLTNQAD